MIIIFGPAGAGKSLQGQLLAARHGWRWLSSGQLLRDSNDPEIHEQMRSGGLADVKKVNQILLAAIERAKSVDKIVMDGYPRLLEEAQWLVESQEHHEFSLQLVIVIEVDTEELKKRLLLRGRADDSIDAIDERLAIYHRETDPILSYFKQHKIPIINVDGNSTVGQVHDRVEAVLVEQGLVEAQ